MEDFKLCYIEDDIAYFTTQDLDKQWGDDWNDAPYDLNAGHPYTPTIYNYADGTSGKEPKHWTDGKPNWEIKEVMWQGFFNEPRHLYIEKSNCIYSIEDINQKKVPWLDHKGVCIKIWAGCSIKEFKSLIRKGGGKIYIEELMKDKNINKKKVRKCCKPSCHGECCCNCENHYKLHSHPWHNKPEEDYVCIIDIKDDSSCPHVTISGEHGMCELHIMKETKKGKK